MLKTVDNVLFVSIKCCSIINLSILFYSTWYFYVMNMIYRNHCSNMQDIDWISTRQCQPVLSVSTWHSLFVQSMQHRYVHVYVWHCLSNSIQFISIKVSTCSYFLICIKNTYRVWHDWFHTDIELILAIYWRMYLLVFHVHYFYGHMLISIVSCPRNVSNNLKWIFIDSIVCSCHAYGFRLVCFVSS